MNIRVYAFFCLFLFTISHAMHKAPVEFKHAVNRYLKHTERTCARLLKPTSQKVPACEKELCYLFTHYGSLSTDSLLSRLRLVHDALQKHAASTMHEYHECVEQISSALILVCAQVVADNACKQLLDALQEIDELLIYWRMQQCYPTHYFFHKSPIKWISGKYQSKEIADNIRKLECDQVRLYTTLGLLAAHTHKFAEYGMCHGGCYLWIEELLAILCIVPEKDRMGANNFDGISAALEVANKCVHNLKDTCVHCVASVQKPSHIARYWIVYSGVLLGMAYGYSYRSDIQQWLEKDLPQKAEEMHTTLAGYVKTIQELVQEVIFGNKAGISPEANRESARTAMIALLNRMIQKGHLSEAKKNGIMLAEGEGNSAPFQTLVNEITSSAWLSANYYDAVSIGLQLVAAHKAVEMSALYKMVLLTPAVFTGSVAYAGINKVYQRIMARDYRVMRYALAEIYTVITTENVAEDATAYGELMYLVYNLQEKAKRDLTGEDRTLLVHDLEMLVSRDYTSDAKLQLIENMRAKYAFLKP